jgi:hypothetical protein
MSVDPLEKPSKYSPETLQKYFGPTANGRDAQELYQKFPDTYRDMRREYLGPTRADDLRELLASKQPKEITDEDLAARARFSLADCKRFYVSESTGRKVDAITSLSAEDQIVLRRAALSYGIPLAVRPKPVQAAKPAPPEAADQVIPQKFCDKFGYDFGTKTTRTAIAKMEAAYLNSEVEKQVAEKQAMDTAQLKAHGLQRNSDGTFSPIANA